MIFILSYSDFLSILVVFHDLYSILFRFSLKSQTPWSRSTHPVDSDYPNLSMVASPVTLRSRAESESARNIATDAANVEEMTVRKTKLKASLRSRPITMSTTADTLTSFPRRRSLSVLRKKRLSTDGATSSDGLRKKEVKYRKMQCHYFSVRYSGDDRRYGSTHQHCFT